MQPFSLGALSPRQFSVGSTTGNTVSPIVVTTTAPHSFVNGDIVTVSGVAGNTNANGTWMALQVGASTLALYDAATGLVPSTGNGATGTGAISAPTQLSFAANDKAANGIKVAKLYFATVIGNAKVSLVGIAGLNQKSLANVIREMNVDLSTGGRADFYNLDGAGEGRNIFNLTDYWIDCIAPTTDAVLVTYWRA